MNKGTATAIVNNCFKNVKSSDVINENNYSDEEITTAIFMVSILETVNGIEKSTLKAALKWVFARYFNINFTYGGAGNE